MIGAFLQPLGEGMVQGLRRNGVLEVGDAVVDIRIVGPGIVQIGAPMDGRLVVIDDERHSPLYHAYSLWLHHHVRVISVVI